MTDAEQAFEAARAEILRVRAAGERVLSLVVQLYSNLTELPKEVATLGSVTFIELDHTQITDLAPLSGLTGLTRLDLIDTPITNLSPLSGLVNLRRIYLRNTRVGDIEPLRELNSLNELHLDGTLVTNLEALSGMDQLTSLSITNTSVLDLRPLIGLGRLGQKHSGGLWYTDTPASRATPELARLSQAPSGNFAKCYRDTREYLLTLPPYPEPLPWDLPYDVPEVAPDVPQIVPLPRLVLTQDDRIDIETVPPTGADEQDPIKYRLYAQLPAAAERLWRAGNQFPQVSHAADALRTLSTVPFSEVDFLSLHLAFAELTDVRALDPERPDAEQLDADCKTALNAVLRIGPPVTMGHPDVDLHEARGADYAQTRMPATVVEAERIIAHGIEQAETLTTQRTRDMARTVAKSGDEGRVATFRRNFARNAILALATVGEAMGAAVIGYVPGTAVAMAMDFLMLHKNAIVAMSVGWGETGAAWVEYILIRTKRAIDKATNGD